MFNEMEKGRVRIFVGGLGPTFTMRIWPLAKALEEFGVNCDITLPISWPSVGNNKLANVLSVILSHPLGEYLTVLKSPPKVVIIGRLSTPLIYMLQIFLKKRGVKIIFDLDDALFLRKGKLFGINVRPGSFFLEDVIRKADFVTVNGNYLLDYVKLFNDAAAIIPDPISSQFFCSKLRKSCDKITIGWEGVPRHHYANMSLLVEPLAELAKKYDFKFKIVSFLGDIKVKKMFSKLEESVDIDYGSRQWLPIEMFPRLLSEIDIMVAPLQRTSWNEGKSALRVGLGMAMGIPVVASPVGEQKYLINHGINGYIARNEKDWYNYLSMLLDDCRLRQEMGKNGRRIAEERLSAKVCGNRLLQIIHDLT